MQEGWGTTPRTARAAGSSSNPPRSAASGRDVSLETIKRWRRRYWIFAAGTNYKDGFEINSMYLCTPAMMEGQFDLFETRFGPDLDLKEAVLGHVGGILKKDKLDRLAYLMDRGMTHNPYIGLKYVREHGVELDPADAAQSLEQTLAEHDGRRRSKSAAGSGPFRHR